MSSRGEKGAYAPDESIHGQGHIQDSMFLLKKGAIIRYSATLPPLVCCVLGAEIFVWWA